MDRDIHPAEISLFVAAALRGYHLADGTDGLYVVTKVSGETVAVSANFKEVANLCGAIGKTTLRQAAERDGLTWPASPEAFIATFKTLQLQEMHMTKDSAAARFAEIDRQRREWDERAMKAQAAAAQAYARLLELAETADSGQVRTVARFIAATYDGDTYPLDLFDLRTVDVQISDDMLVCLDALRWGKADLYKLVPDGDQRIRSMCQAWGLK